MASPVPIVNPPPPPPPPSTSTHKDENQDFVSIPLTNQNDRNSAQNQDVNSNWIRTSSHAKNEFEHLEFQSFRTILFVLAYTCVATLIVIYQFTSTSNIDNHSLEVQGIRFEGLNEDFIPESQDASRTHLELWFERTFHSMKKVASPVRVVVSRYMKSDEQPVIMHVSKAPFYKSLDLSGYPLYPKNETQKNIAIDVGAAEGIHYSLKARLSGLKVYAFEPDPQKIMEFIETMSIGENNKIKLIDVPQHIVTEKNAKLVIPTLSGKAAPNIHLISVALGEEKGPKMIGNTKDKSCGYVTESNREVFKCTSKTVPVSKIRLDDVQGIDGGRVWMINIPITMDGQEAQILRGGLRLLRRNSIPFIAFHHFSSHLKEAEPKPPKFTEMLQILHNTGYICYHSESCENQPASCTERSWTFSEYSKDVLMKTKHTLICSLNRKFFFF